MLSPRAKIGVNFIWRTCGCDDITHTMIFLDVEHSLLNLINYCTANAVKSTSRVQRLKLNLLVYGTHLSGQLMTFRSTKTELLKAQLKRMLLSLHKFSFARSSRWKFFYNYRSLYRTGYLFMKGNMCEIVLPIASAAKDTILKPTYLLIGPVVNTNCHKCLNSLANATIYQSKCSYNAYLTKYR